MIGSMTADSEITTEHRPGQQGGRFALLDDQTEIGELDYVWRAPSVMNIHHTGVREAYGGRGLARRLVDTAVAFAREHGHRIAPTCSYAVRVLADDAYDDVRG